MPAHIMIMSENRWLGLILGLFGLLGVIYALVTPPFEASDELWHYPMVRHLADGNPLPVQDPANVGPWKQEASQPPLYYYVGALLTFWVDTVDWQSVRWLNPHVDSGVITADGNVNLAIHDPVVSRWRGTLLAVTVVRLASVLMSAGTLYFTYQIAKSLTPRPEIRLGATALNAFLPMFLFISAAVNNDNLAIPLTSLALLLMIRAVQKGADAQQFVTKSKRELFDLILLGIVVGCAALTKEGTLALFPLSGGTLFLVAWQRAGRPTNGVSLLKLIGQALGRFWAVIVPALLICGWWYWRNLQLYGDWLGWNAFLAVLGQRAHPASLAQLWDERWGLLISYWGLFGGLNVPMPNWIYTVLNTVLLMGMVGFGLYLFRLLQEQRRQLSQFGKMPRLSRSIFAILHFVESHFPLVLCLLLTGAVVYGLVQWATVTWSSQGRLLFTAISALNILLVLGLVGWMPAHFARPIITTLATFLFGVAAFAPFLWIRPVYQPPMPAQTDLSYPLDLQFGQQLRLTGYEIDKTTVHPGEQLSIRLAWEVLSPMPQDWSIFVHLNDPVLGVPIAQRDMYLGRGLLPTRLLSVGQKGVDTYILSVPATAIAPAELRLAVGFYDFYTKERLFLADGSDVALLTTIQLEPIAGTVPNSVSILFEDQLELVGYEISHRRIQPNEMTTLTLYWRASQPLETDYTLFAQMVGAENHRWAAADVQASTTTWQAGEVQSVMLPLTVDGEVPAGVYPLIIGVYTLRSDGVFDRLQTVTSEGRLTDDFIQLTQIRVER